LLDTPDDRVVGSNPKAGLEVLARNGRFGPYVQLGHADPASKDKPKSASLLSSMSLETITLDDALKVLSLPRVLGADPADDEEITVQNGRYGPYVKKGNDSRSLAGEDQLFSLTLDEALLILAEPKRRRGQGEAKGPLREIGADPDTGKPIVAKDGRFGVYVTDGETNASLRKGDMVETLTLERACELLAERRRPLPGRQARARHHQEGRRSTGGQAVQSSGQEGPRKAAKAGAAKKPAKK
jgi:DNA topoisomerase-1